VAFLEIGVGGRDHAIGVPAATGAHARPCFADADVATLSEVQGLGPVWLRLQMDVSDRRLLGLRMITAGHFMSQAWSASDQPLAIDPPRG
jgi:hypothetical protein